MLTSDKTRELIAEADARLQVLAEGFPLENERGQMPDLEWVSTQIFDVRSCLTDALAALSTGDEEPPKTGPEPEWEYGFIADGGAPVWYCFGLPFKSASMARHTGAKCYWATLEIVKRRPGSDEVLPVEEEN